MNYGLPKFNNCPIHLLVQILFDHVQIYLTVFNIFWMCSNIFDHAQICKFIWSCFWPWSKNLTVFKKYWTCSKKFECGKNNFWTSRWNRHESYLVAGLDLTLCKIWWREQIWLCSQIWPCGQIWSCGQIGFCGQID